MRTAVLGLSPGFGSCRAYAQCPRHWPSLWTSLTEVTPTRLRLQAQLPFRCHHRLLPIQHFPSRNGATISHSLSCTDRSYTSGEHFISLYLSCVNNNCTQLMKTRKYQEASQMGRYECSSRSKTVWDLERFPVVVQSRTREM